MNDQLKDFLRTSTPRLLEGSAHRETLRERIALEQQIILHDGIPWSAREYSLAWVVTMMILSGSLVVFRMPPATHEKADQWVEQMMRGSAPQSAAPNFSRSIPKPRLLLAETSKIWWERQEDLRLVGLSPLQNPRVVR